MNPNHRYRFSFPHRLNEAFFTLVVVLTCLHASAQTTLTSVPANSATGVSPSADVVFTFSGPMDTSTVSVSFYSLSPFGVYTVDSSWNAANNVLTCTPTPPFPGNTSISWAVDGNDVGNNQVVDLGSFTTGTGSGGGATGYGTNKFTSFTVGKVYLFSQAGQGVPPVPSVSGPFGPFLFSGSTTLASNRTANTITLTLPNSAVSNLTQNIVAKENYYLASFDSSSNSLETTFPQGAYTFTVNATASNQTVSVTLPPTMTQPNAPQILNFTAAQAVDVSQPFTLSWSPFIGGSSSDLIVVTVGNWTSPEFGATNALDGTSTSITIPTGALQANSNYEASVAFEHIIWSTNTTYTTGAYRSTLTDFSLNTVAATAPLPVLSNPGWNGNTFGFDVDTTSGQTLTVVYSADCSLPLSQWQKLITTNSPGPRVHITDANAGSTPAIYYNVRNGP